MLTTYWDSWQYEVQLMFTVKPPKFTTSFKLTSEICKTIMHARTQLSQHK